MSMFGALLVNGSARGTIFFIGSGSLLTAWISSAMTAATEAKEDWICYILLN